MNVIVLAICFVAYLSLIKAEDKDDNVNKLLKLIVKAARRHYTNSPLRQIYDEDFNIGHRLPGHSLIKPKTTMLKSSVQYPNEDKNLVYGNTDNLGITYDKTPFRVLYSGFRKGNDILANIIKAAKASGYTVNMKHPSLIELKRKQRRKKLNEKTKRIEDLLNGRVKLQLNKKLRKKALNEKTKRIQDLLNGRLPIPLPKASIQDTSGERASKVKEFLNKLKSAKKRLTLDQKTKFIENYLNHKVSRISSVNSLGDRRNIEYISIAGNSTFNAIYTESQGTIKNSDLRDEYNLKDKLKDLQLISIAHNSDLRDDYTLNDKLKDLQFISIAHNSDLRDDDTLNDKLKDLQFISIAHNSDLRDDYTLNDKLKDLQFISIAHNSDIDVNALNNKLKDVEFISIAHNSDIDINSLNDKLKDMQIIAIAHNSDIDVNALNDKHKDIQFIAIAHNSGIRDVNSVNDKYKDMDLISIAHNSINEGENNANEILDVFSSDESDDQPNYRRAKKKKSKYRLRDTQYNVEEGSSDESASSDYERNPGNPFTIHKNKYKQNWLWNHFMDGDHMNINPLGPTFGTVGPTGADLFFGRKWWYYNQDDYKPMG